jgi:hypothetical protein
VKRPLNEIETFRAQELLLQRATEGLDDREAAELVALGAEDDMSFDLAASGVDLATLQYEEMPADLADKIMIASGVDTSATTVMPAVMPMQMTTLAGVLPPRPLSTTKPPVVEPPPAVEQPPMRTIGTPGQPLPTVEPHTPTDQPPSVRFTPQQQPAPVIPIESRKKSRATTYAVIAAAASIVLAAGAIVYATQIVPTEKIVEVPAQPPKTPTAAEARAELLATAKDATTLPWTATQDPNATGASGDVVWSASRQRGFMRFKGLAPNDLKTIQYQLWIFDKDRDQAFPVDGGVFDVGSNGEVIVEISAKLRVNEPVLFAVTIEKPGGVVVSKRERIVVTAAPKA